jgi:23S rRNA (adenine2503-C2)-methyltransferase
VAISVTIPLHDLKGLLPDQLRQIATDLGEPSYRGDQLFEWLHVHQARDLDGMTNLPARFRQVLAEAGAQMPGLELLESSASDTGKAVKFLFDLGQGGNGQGLGQVEAVLIIDGDRRTACLSSQVGCALDCKFCATAQMGFVRNLHAGQIVEQLHQLHQQAQRRGERLTNIVMMGMGEPLLNYEQVTCALRLARASDGQLQIGGRKMTVSTAGHVPGILRLSEDDLNVGLAISLNATEDETRSQIMPINRKWPIADLMAAAKTYFDRKGRRVTFEYVLMDQVTDLDADADRLAVLTSSIPCKINLIPYNELAPGLQMSDRVYRRPSSARLDRFTRRLKNATRHTVTRRDSRGRDIDAACGQLHRRVTDAQSAVSATPQPA